jgi:hypothetical protein
MPMPFYKPAAWGLSSGKAEADIGQGLGVVLLQDEEVVALFLRIWAQSSRWANKASPVTTRPARMRSGNEAKTTAAPASS